MSFRFILGRSGSGKSHYCMKEIRQKLHESPFGSPLIYLVPEQMTFQAEYELAKTPGLNGMIRAQVFSFRRLAWKVLQEVGGITRQHINRAGIKMVLRKSIEHRKDELKIFGRAAGQMGFTDQLEEIYTELKRYMISPDQLLNQIEEFGDNLHEPSFRLLADKLHDLHLIYQDTETSLRDRYIDSEDYLRLLAERIPKSKYIKEAEVWIDGFHGFTPQEYAVLLSLLQYSKRVSMTLCMDKPIHEHELEQLDLFLPANITFLKMKEMTKKLGVPVETVHLHNESTAPRFKSPALAYLERNFGNRINTPYTDEADGIILTAAVNRRTEVEEMARQILELVRERGYRWREIVILVRNIESYKELIETVFSDYEIPVFLDQKRAMFHHPLIELIRSALEVLQTNWHPEAVFRCVKTDFFLPYVKMSENHKFYWRNQFDQLENYVLSRGIKGERWTNGKPWKIKSGSFSTTDKDSSDQNEKEERRLNQMRELIVKPLYYLQKAIHDCTNVKEMCTALYEFLVHLKVPEHLEQWSIEAQSALQLERAKEHSQVWHEVIGMLDQLVEIMDEEEISFELFAKMIESGLEGMQFSLVPPSLDQVLAGSIGRTRYSHIRATFILGINDGVLPAVMKEDGLFLESEREILSKHGMEMAPGIKQKLMEEQFLIYTTLTSPSEKLYLSYPLADEEGKSLLPSEIIKQMKKLFPRLKERLITLEIDDHPMAYIHHPRTTLSLLAGQLRKMRQGYTIAPDWFWVYNWFIKHQEWRGLTERLLRSLFYRNQEDRLTETTTRKLYGNHLKASISRLEKYRSCPFAHFASYGLRLEERDIYRLEYPDIGQLYHASLSRLLESVREKGLDLGQMSGEQIHLLATSAVDELAPELQNEILLSSNRYKYIHRKLKNVVGRTAAVLGMHARNSQFSPIALELPFGPGMPLPSLQFKLPNGCSMELIGRIDRVDQAKGSQGVLLRIIDYKSSKTSLVLEEVYYGLSLQMLIYLDVVISNAEQWLGTKASPAGMLYFHVHNPLVSSDVPLPRQEAEKKALAKYKMNGYLLADVENIRLMDTSLTNGWSEILPVAITKDERFYDKSKVVSMEQLQLLRQHVRQIIQGIGTEITDGVVEITPYKLNKKTPCTYCVYKPVCQFDILFEADHYRILKKINQEELWRLLTREGGGGNEYDPDQTSR